MIRITGNYSTSRSRIQKLYQWRFRVQVFQCQRSNERYLIVKVVKVINLMLEVYTFNYSRIGLDAGPGSRNQFQRRSLVEFKLLTLVGLLDNGLIHILEWNKLGKSRTSTSNIQHTKSAKMISSQVCANCT